MAERLNLTSGIVYLQGAITGGDGTSALPAFSFASEPTLGFWRSSAGVVTLQGALISTGNLTSGTNLISGSSNFFIFGLRSTIGAPVDGALAFTNSAQTGFSTVDFGPSGAALSSRRIQKVVTGIADNTTTAVVTVTVPNANHACAIRLMLVSSNGSTDAFESTRAASGMVVLARTAGVDTVATAIALTDAGIASVAAGATHTLAYTVTAMVGASSATQTFTINVTIDDTGNLGSSQVLVIAETLNSNATGVTIA